MKKILILFVLLFISIACIFSATAKVFYVNLFNEKVDVRLGEEKGVFQKSGLDPFTATRLSIIKKTGSFKLYFKLSDDKKWSFWGDEKTNEPIMCDVNDQEVVCILCGYDGKMDFFTLDEPEGSGAYVCFLNGNDEALTKMSIGKAWGDDIVYTENLDKNALTHFVLLKQGSYGMFWQFQDQAKKGNHFFYPDDNGDIDMVAFKNGKYYIFMAYLNDGEKYANCFEITP
jgi:hypothetical protein